MHISWRQFGSFLLALLGVVCVGEVSTLEARSDDEKSIWNLDPERCVNVNGLEHRGYSTLLTDQSLDDTSDAVDTSTSCDQGSGDVSNNVCFEGAGAPASVRPEMMARSKAIQAFDHVARSLQDVLGENTGVAWRGSASSKPDLDAPEPRHSDSKNSCTAHPDTCRGLPPLPPSLSGDSSRPLVQRRIPMEIPELEWPDDTGPIPHMRRVEPSPGHQSPPHKPPRDASRMRG